MFFSSFAAQADKWFVGFLSVLFSNNQSTNKKKSFLLLLFLTIFNTFAVAGDNELFDAIKTRDIGTLRGLIASGYNVNTKISTGNTPLHIAIYSGFTEGAKALIGAPSVDVNITNNKQMTALHVASYKGNAEILSMLIPFSYINARDEYGNTALINAVFFGHRHCIDLLLDDKRTEINAINTASNTSLMRAASKGHTDYLLKLLIAGADTSIRNKNNCTALHEAALGGHTGCVRWLVIVDSGDINHADNYGNTALHNAAIAGDVESLHELIAGGADVNACNHARRTALSCAIKKGHKACINLLLKTKNIDPYYVDTEGHGAIHDAVFSGDSEILYSLLVLIIRNINARDTLGNTALHYAVTNNKEMVEILLTFEADWTIKNYCGQTAADLAWRNY